MAHSLNDRTHIFGATTENEYYHRKYWKMYRLNRFAKACRAEIARLRGEG